MRLVVMLMTAGCAAGLLALTPQLAMAKDVTHLRDRCMAGPKYALPSLNDNAYNQALAKALASPSYQTNFCNCVVSKLEKPLTQEQIDIVAGGWGHGGTLPRDAAYTVNSTVERCETQQATALMHF